MHGRVNTKFVVVLVAVLVTLPGLLFGYWHLVIRTNPDKLIEQANEYLAQGLAEKAVQGYAKAFSARTDDVGLMLNYVHAMTQVKTTDSRTARGYVGQMIGTLHRAITQEPLNPVPFEKLMQLHMKLGRDMNDFESWNRMYEDADSRIRANPDGHGNILAMKYRGIARVNRMESLDLTADEREEARTDLSETIKQIPEDRDATYYLAAWHLLEARDLKQSGADKDAIDKHLAEASRITAQAIKEHPNEVRRQLDRLSVLGSINRIGETRNQEEVMRLLEVVEQGMLNRKPVLRLVLELIELLPDRDREKLKAQPGGRPLTTSGLVRAERVLQNVIDNYSQEPRYLATLARVLEAQRRYKEAMHQYKQVFESQVRTNVFEAIQLDRLKAGSIVKYVELRLKLIDAMSQAERQEAIEEVEALMGRIVDNYGESPQVNLLQGKIAMARGQWGQASTKLDLANTQFEGTVPEALWLSSKAWVRMGEVGAATDRLEQLIQIRPDYLPARYELIRLYLQLNQLNEAQKHVDQLLDIDSDNPKARRAQGSVLAQRGQTEQAIDVYLSLDLEQNPKLIPILAGLYVTSGDQDSAIQILEKRFKQVPTDIEILQSLVRTSYDKDQAKQYIKTAREAGADPQALGILESQFEGKATLAQVLETLIDADEVPFRRHLKRYRMYRRMSRQEEAKQELQQAAAIEPDHPMIVSAKFDQAIADQDWAEAEKMAGRAAKLNNDMADGMFYFGRLEAARGRLDRALANYRSGLEKRKIYSEGWRQLGDVQRMALDWNGAVVTYGIALEQRPNNVLALTGLAIALHALDKQSEALENLRKAVKFNPQNVKLREHYLAYEKTYGDIKRALKLRQRIAVVQPQDLANRRAMAILYSGDGQLAKATQVIEELIQQTGVNRLNITAAATVRNADGDSDGAQKLLQDYVHGLGEKATDEDWMMLARFLVRVGNDEHARAAYRQAILVEDSKLQRATREYADLLFGHGEYAEAVGRYELLWETAREDERVGNRYVEALLRVNEPKRARQVLQIVTKQHGVNAGTYVLEALIARAHGEMDVAMAALNRAIELDPRRAIIYYQRADLQASDQNLENQVMDDLNQALLLDPDLSAARRMLATIRVRRGERDEAIRELRTLVRRRPRHIAARLQLARLYLDGGQSGLRRALLIESEKMFPKSAIWPQMLAQQALIENDISLAIAKLEQAYALSRSPQTLAELSALLIQFDKADLALSLLRSEGEIVRFHAILHALRGRALTAIGDSDLAVRAFARAIEQSSSFKQVAGVAVQISHGIGWEETIQLLEQWIDGPKSSLIELAIVQIESETQKYDAAINRLKRIDAMVPEGSPERLHFDRLMALVLYQQGYYEDALEVYQRLLDRQPNNLVTLNNTAYLLTESLGRAKEAVSLSKRAAELAPNNPLVLDTLGWTLYKTGEIDLAHRALLRSVQIKPTVLSCMHLAEVLKEKSDLTGAAERLKQAKDLAQEADDQQNLWMVTKRLEELMGPSRP